MSTGVWEFKTAKPTDRRHWAAAGAALLCKCVIVLLALGGAGGLAAVVAMCRDLITPDDVFAFVQHVKHATTYVCGAGVGGVAAPFLRHFLPAFVAHYKEVGLAERRQTLEETARLVADMLREKK